METAEFIKSIFYGVVVRYHCRSFPFRQLDSRFGFICSEGQIKLTRARKSSAAVPDIPLWHSLPRSTCVCVRFRSSGDCLGGRHFLKSHFYYHLHSLRALQWFYLRFSFRDFTSRERDTVREVKCDREVGTDRNVWGGD